MNIKIRPALPEEANILSHIAYSAKAHWGYPQRWMEIWKPQLTFSPEYFKDNENWVAEKDGTPIAFYTLLEKDSKAWIENLWVLPEWIGKGIGRRLFLHALSRSRLNEYLILQLEADPNAVSFYKKQGMYKIGESLYEVEGQPRILPLMEIKLLPNVVGA
jgi:ribosomal protein S18 acetylase RimI-like enzyme